MARLVRFLDSSVSIALPFVGSAHGRSALEKIRVYVEVIPRDVTDVVRESLKDIPQGGGLVDDALGYESAHDAVLNAEHVGSRIIGDVIPQNLFLVFGQTMESLRDALKSFPLPPPSLNPPDPATAHCDQKKGNRRQEKNPENKAIILCKLRKTESLAEIIAAKKDEPRHQANRCEVSWGELEVLKKRLKKVRHLSVANVKEHATLSARARVVHGVKVECRESHVNRAADRGCVSRLVVPLAVWGLHPESRGRSAAGNEDLLIGESLRLTRLKGNASITRDPLKSLR